MPSINAFYVCTGRAIKYLAGNKQHTFSKNSILYSNKNAFQGEQVDALLHLLLTKVAQPRFNSMSDDYLFKSQSQSQVQCTYVQYS